MWIIQRQIKARTVRNKREKMELINVVLGEYNMKGIESIF